MRFILFVIVALILCLFVTGYQAQSVETPDEMDIGQSTRGSGMTTPRPPTAPTTAPSRTPTTPTTPSTRPTRRPSRRMRPPRMTWRDMMPGLGMGMSRDAIRMMRMESNILMRMLRALLELRMRAMMDIPRDMPLSRWEKKMIRMMALRDMLMMMGIQAQETDELASMMVTDEEPETPMDESVIESEHETEAEPEMEHDTEAVPEHEQEENAMMDQEFDDPTLIETEFDIAEPYGYGKKGGYGYGYGGGKKGFNFNFGLGGKKGGFGFGFNKKAPFKKVAAKKGGYGGFY